MAMRHKVSEFVLVSTDKAVRPSNVMGVTKRAAELAICGLRRGRAVSWRCASGTCWAHGSVVPLFRQQMPAAAR